MKKKIVAIGITVCGMVAGMIAVILHTGKKYAVVPSKYLND